MKWIALGCLLAANSGLAQTADRIDLKDISATFTNLQGEVYTNVTLAHANLDGITYFCEGGGGVVSFTNLTPAQLQQWGIPTNRIAIAAQRAAEKAERDRQYWLAHNAQAQTLQAQYDKQWADEQAREAAAAAAAAASTDNSQTNAPATTGKKSGKKHKNGN